MLYCLLVLAIIVGLGLEINYLASTIELKLPDFVACLLAGIILTNYDAAVISSGYIGLALEATPTAIANMTAVTEKFGASPQAFIIVPYLIDGVSVNGKL